MCRAWFTIRGPFIRGMRQRLSAVPIAARSRSSNVAAPGDPEPVFTETVLLDDLVS